ncbi:hypothetical protein BRD00_15490 [Halobacteriales archaeon QS_8_69_26]|nr:MAG: hypothetical protein BRD00_15490 [Halobacteriales archaeon QS_8_69_26]
MEEAATCRRAVRDAIRDIAPSDLRTEMGDVIDGTSLVPGALTIVSARAAGGDPDHVTERAAGVQLIYSGLGLIRKLAREDPWAGRVTLEGDDVEVEGDLTEADMAILAADVLVSRGFYVLAHTDAAGKAVETVRNFGRDQTLARSSEDPSELDANLEVDCLELAVIAGTTGVGTDPSTELVEAARRIAREAGVPLGDAEDVLTDPDLGEDADPLVDVAGTDAEGAARTSASDS